MNTKMNTREIYELLKTVGKAIDEQLPEIIKPLPVCGESLSVALKAVRKGIEDFKSKKISEEEYRRIKSEFNDAVKEEAAQAKTPVYMDCVIFRCKSGCTLSDDQRNMITGVFEGESEDASGVIRRFVSRYMGGTVEMYGSDDDDCFIGEDYVSLNFFVDEEEYPYDEEVLHQLRQAINNLVGRDVLDYFVAYGHDESYGE